MLHLPLIWILLLISLHLISANMKYLPPERIISDITQIENFRGVPLNFHYNETGNSNTNQLISSPGCPKSIDGYPWIYFKYDGECRCYLAGTTGPCPFGQVLFVKPGTPCGVCGCECLLNGPNFEEENQNYQMCWSSAISQSQVYDRRDKSVCYNLNEQGPCPDGKMIRIGENGNTLNCLPPCNFDDKDWIDKSANGECIVKAAAFGSAGFGLSNLPSLTDCPSDEEKFSKILRKCVKRNPKMNLLLG